MNNTHKLLALHACCIPVIGKRRSVICDLQRSQYYFIPNALYALVTTYSGHTVADLAAEFKDDFATIQEYISFIETNDLGRLIDPEDAALFPPLDMSWVKPEIITNAILEVDQQTSPQVLEKIAGELDALGCKGLQIRVFEAIPLDRLSDVVAAFDRSRLRHIDLVCHYDDNHSREAVLSLIHRFERISFITVYNSPFSEVVEDNNETPILFYETTAIDSHLSCGLISQDYFSINLDTFTEARHHNSCLNRKIAIDADGNIKNCPSMPKSFGNIRQTTLQEALEHPDFKQHWNITKDQVDTCRACEFRYICTDCRAFVEQPGDVHSKPLKCGYNPDTATWEDWSTHPLKQKAIDHYGMRDLLGCENQAHSIH